MNCLDFLQFKHFSHLLMICYLVNQMTPCTYAQSPAREPASYHFDDELIEVPLEVEKSFMEKVHTENEQHLTSSKRQIEQWIQNQEEAESYGLENRGVFQTVTIEQRQNYIQRNYLRFFSRRVERNNNEALQEWTQSWNTNDELDSIENFEEREGYIIKAKKSQGAKNLDRKKEVKVGKQKFEFGFQPRIEMGMMRITMKSPYLKARAWLGVNGNQELRVERRFSSTGTRLYSDYYIDQERLLAVADQRLGRYFSLRFTHEKFNPDNDLAPQSEFSENNLLQLRFNMGF